MYWSTTTGAKYVVGGILTRYRATGAQGTWGFPTTDEVDVAGGRASYFQKAHIYWTRSTGAREVHGAILKKFLSTGGPTVNGFPTTDETKTADGVGRFNHFTASRSIYWTSGTGAHLIRGGIRSTWVRLGAERSRLRYPSSDERATSYGAVSYFQGGRIEWRRATNTIGVYVS